MVQAYRPNFPQKVTGSLYPTNYVVCVIDDLGKARQAEQAFKDAGYDANTVRLMNSEEALEKIQELEQRKNRFQRFFSSFQDATDDTGTDIFRFEAKLGHHLLYVRACAYSVRTCSTHEIEQIRDIMAAFNAHAIKFFGFWWVEDVPPPSTNVQGQ